ncbi:putative Sterol 3-beta-glucosyltransferase [Glarea lozoyensis 74030]|uniref:Putative Sterol 3-beta-glucosyltransferase n=1 Tax=Glarea lozoyensis (strain ATCC 74030 / MF5533) TaxID=1104152 RepID=H0ER36_GLAL7|nr:putative Sterol 3-beta-glucosyltransferase [Glarea lozoyensis 74030]
MTAAAASRGASDPTAEQTLASPSNRPLANTMIPEETRSTSEEGPRPNLPRTWQTERPQVTARYSVLPARMARMGTNTSALNTAILSASRGDDTSSSESSILGESSGCDLYERPEAGDEAGDKQRRQTGIFKIVFSRGDIQPFLKLGKNLQEYGHRVRIATHPAFKDFVEKDSGLEFFSVGGDPAELMAFMVKNPGMIPTMDTLKKGEVGRRRSQMAEMFEGFWRACINATDDEKDVSNLKMMGEKNPFGLGDLINNFRVKTLGLEPVSTLWAPGQLYRMKVPYTYLWSPGLIPKPADWGPEIDIAGFVFLDLASSFKPPEELVKFLDAGPPPVYIGFGSIVVDDPDKFTAMIFEAVEKAGVRALVSKGWGGLGDENNTPDNIFMLENTPHDWLFPKVEAVVHHGGAGTTAIGLKCGKPTMVVPFFGDQQFWGSMIGKAGAGAEPVPYKSLTADKLAEGIKQCLTDKAKEEAMVIAKNIEAEGDGAKNAVTSFHRSLVLRGEHSMRCSVLEDRVAVWILKDTRLRLSALAAELLVQKKRISWKQLRLIRHNEWNDFEGPGEPLTGGATAIMGTVTGIASGIGSIPFRLRKTTKRRTEKEERRQRKSQEAQAKSSVHKSLRKNGIEKSKSNSVRSPSSNGVTGNGQPKESTVNGAGENDHPVVSPAQQTINERVAAEHMATVAPGPKTPILGMGKHTPSGEPIPAHRAANGDSAEDYFDKASIATAPEDNPAEEYARDVGGGLGRTGEAVARLPMDLTLAVAQGFHNAPRLYGDTTVRRPTRITGMKSGLKAAGEEFVYGIYDGFTGVVVQPYKGARDGGPVGFVKGVGMGLTGFVLKDLAAIFGPFGYTLKGAHKELMKSKQPTHFIRKAKIVQGQRNFKALSDEEKKKAIEQVDHGWEVVQQIWEIMEEKKADGLKGRVKFLKEKKTWRANGAFENVEMAERALEARRKGESLEGVFERQREELKLAERPRKNVQQDMQEGEGGVEDVGQVVQTNGSAEPPVKKVPSLA